VAQDQRSPDDKRNLADEIVKAILEDEDLAAQLGQGLGHLEAKKCPKDFKCKKIYACPKPFSCPKGYSQSPKVFE